MDLHIVTGPPRTGTTLLQELLTSDGFSLPLFSESVILSNILKAFSYGVHTYPNLHEGVIRGEDYVMICEDFIAAYLVRTE